jgi:hypothetical protein
MISKVSWGALMLALAALVTAIASKNSQAVLAALTAIVSAFLPAVFPWFVSAASPIPPPPGPPPPC